jgi:tetratricopeptide (TPR) repeat protein
MVNHERMVAERRFQQVRQLANQVLALDLQIREVPGATKARQAIVAMSREYLQGLESEAGGDPALSRELGTAYLRLARVQGVPVLPNLGMHEEARQSLIKAETLMQSVVRAKPGDVAAHFALADISHDLMILAETEKDDDAALAQGREAADRLEAALRLRPAPAAEVMKVAERFVNISLMYKNQHRYDDSIRIARRVLELAGPQGDAEVRVNAWSMIADSLRFSGDLPGALHAITQAREIPAPSTRTALTSINQSNVLIREAVILGGDGQISLERPEEAVAALQQAFDLLEAMAAQDPNDARSRTRLSHAAKELGPILRHDRPERALQVYEHALRRVREVPNNVAARRVEAQIMALSAYVLRRLNRAGEAGERIDRAVQMLRETKLYPAALVPLGDEVEWVVRAWADHLAETEDPRRAAEKYEELLDKVMASHPDPEHDLRHATGLSRLYDAMSRLHRRLDRADRANSLAAARLDICQGWSRRLPDNPFVQKQLRAASLN